MFRAVMLLGSIATVAVSQQLEYPKAKKGDLVDDYFGTKVPDPYRWLEDTDSAETADWVKARECPYLRLHGEAARSRLVPGRVDETSQLPTVHRPKLGWPSIRISKK